MLDKQLLDRFLRNTCTAEERRIVLDYLKAHPDEAAGLLPQQEFEEVNPENWDPQRSERSFLQIQQRLNHHTHPLIRWSLAAAATITLFFGIRWLVAKPNAPAQLAAAKTEPRWITEANNSLNTRTLTLPDGSSAELAPGTKISYHPTFTSDDRRIVKLDGEGQFNVTGDPAKPFMVVSGELTTTVLGTWFSVTADPGAQTIKVHLYEGKVKVAGTDGVRWKTKDSVLFLQPGEELTYNKRQMLAVIRSPKTDLALNKPAGPRTTSASSQRTAASKPEWYRFGGQSLTDVFDQLSDYYGVQINYFPADVANRYFTGKFSKDDSLEDILNDIALLHNLKLTKKEGMFVFRKK
jgi:ferric-dicitrate binding protein FerR (iron transport regulator)